MPASLKRLARAARGDEQALADIIRAHDHNRNAVALLTAVAVSVSAPHPLAAPAMQERPPGRCAPWRGGAVRSASVSRAAAARRRARGGRIARRRTKRERANALGAT